MAKIYVEKNQFTKQNGEIQEYEKYYIYSDNNCGVEKLKVYIDLTKEVKELLNSLGALYYEDKEK